MDRTLLAAAFAALAIVVSPCATISSALGAGGGVDDVGLRIAVGARTDVFLPYGVSRVGAIITDHLYDQLLEADPSNPGRFGPALATAWTVAPDGTTAEFTLRRDATWHDGPPVTAEDVRFTFDFVLVPTNRSQLGRDLVECGAQCEVLDPHRVRFTFARPRGGVFERLVGSQFKILPRHCLENADAEAVGAFGRHPVGSGPYRFARKTGNRIRLVRNDRWWGKAPFFSAVTFKEYSASEAMLSDLKSGAVDFVPRLKDEAFFDDLAPRADRAAVRAAVVRSGSTVLRAIEHPRLRFGAFSGGHVSIVAWNCRRGPTADLAVRQALACLLDRDRLARRSADRPTTSFRPLESAGYDRNLVPVPFSPERARTILRKARWIDRDRDGVLDRDGERLALTLVVPANSNVTAIKQLAAAARAIGIDIELRAVDRKQHGVLRRAHDFDGLFWALTISADQDPFPLWHGTGIYNVSGLTGLDALVERVRSATNHDDRARWLRTLHDRVHAAQPILFVNVITQLAAWDKRLEGVRFHPLRSYGWNLLEWSARPQ